MFCRRIQAGTPLCPLLGILTATLGFHKYTHVPYPKYPTPPWRVIYAAWKDQGSGSTHNKYLHFTCSVSILYLPHCAWCRHCQHTCENCICLKNPFSSAPYWQELTDWRIISERKPFWHLRCGDNQPMNRKSSIRVDNCSCTQLVPANIFCTTSVKDESP